MQLCPKWLFPAGSISLGPAQRPVPKGALGGRDRAPAPSSERTEVLSRLRRGQSSCLASARSRCTHGQLGQRGSPPLSPSFSIPLSSPAPTLLQSSCCRTFCPSPKSPWHLSVAPFSPSPSSLRCKRQSRAPIPSRPPAQCFISRRSAISAPVAMPVAACALFHGDSNHLQSPCPWPRSKNRPSTSAFHILSAKWA